MERTEEQHEILPRKLQTSYLRHCTHLTTLQLYWLLWYNNLLIAALTLRVLYGLMRRKILVYPTLEELRTHRRWEDQADSFSKRLVMRLTTSPAEGVKSLWRGIRRKMNKQAEDNSKSLDISGQTATSSIVPDIFVEDSTEDVDATGVRTEDVPLADSHLAAPLLDVANGLADVHERIRKYVSYELFLVIKMLLMAILVCSCGEGLKCQYCSLLYVIVVMPSCKHCSPVLAGSVMPFFL